MPNPIIHSSDHFVVLEPCSEEKFLTASETISWLTRWLNELEQLPKDLKTQPSIAAAAKHLLDTACDLEIRPGFKIQWFAIRLDPNSP